MYQGMLAFVLLLPVCAHAEGVYDIRPLCEPDVLKTYTTVMLDACRHSNGQWHDWSVDTTAGYWGDGVSEGNQGIRAIAETLLTYGALIRYCPSALRGAEREEFIRQAQAALRYATSTHVTGTRNCTDGKRWGKSWQSGMWTGTMAFGAWLMWSELDAGLRKDIERVVECEADRLLAITPPTGRWSDTKAEENGWDLTCISIATNMLPSHPHAAAWNEKAIEYMMNTLSVPRDLEDGTAVDGRPVSERVHGANLHPDFTLENHGVFHPSYVQCSSYFLTEAAMHYRYGGRAVPEAATHHLMDTWRMFQTILLPSGETTYPQGQDWELHGLNPINLFGSLATSMRDPLAAGMEKVNLQYMRAWQEMCGGSLAAPGSALGFTRHAIQGAQAAFGFLAHKVFGPAAEGKTSPGEAMAQLRGVRRYSSVGVVLHRTASKLASFSWKYRVMGVITPIGEGHLDAPFFAVPITNGLVGTTELSSGGKADVKVVGRTWKTGADGFQTAGTLATNGGTLKQTLRVDSVGEKTVVYQDRVTALSDVSVARELGVPIGIENDRVSGGKRTVYHQGGNLVFDWAAPQPLASVSGPWANIDGRLGVVVVEGSGLTYSQAARYNGQGVYADIMYGSFSDRLRQFKAGEQVARRIVVLFAEVTPEATSALSKSIRIEDGVLRFSLPEGGECLVTVL